MENVYDFVSNSNLFKKFEVNDLLFVEYKCLFPENKVAYWTSSNYFIYVLGGRKRYVSGNNEYLIEVGEGVFIKRGVYVVERFDNEDFCALVIFVPDNFIESVTRKYAGLHASSATAYAKARPNVPRYSGAIAVAQADTRRRDEQQPIAGDSIIRMNMDEAFSSYFHSVLSYFPKPVSPPGELLLIKFEELILNILTSPDNDELSAQLLSIRKNDKVDIREIMEKYFMHPLGLNEYARLCARSLSSFKADFFDTFKTSPGKWLMTKRLEHARLLIETTEAPVSEVAAKAGFKNTSHFVRIFKDTYGKPPLQYRQVRLVHA